MDAIRLSVIVFLLGAKYDQIPAQQGDRYASRQLRQIQQAGDQAGSRYDDPNLAQGLVNLFLVQFHYYRSIALLAWSRYLSPDTCKCAFAWSRVSPGTGSEAVLLIQGYSISHGLIT